MQVRIVSLVHMIIKHFHLHFMANRIFNNILYFLSFLFFSFRLPQKQNLGSYDHPTKQKTHNQKLIILFCLFFFFLCPFVPHCAPDIVWFNFTYVNLTRINLKNIQIYCFLLFPYIYIVVSFFCTKYDREKNLYIVLSHSLVFVLS